jgi:hypothetical protein
MLRMMPWGWRLAYLNDPDGHEISIYWAGENRMKKTVVRAAMEVEQAPSVKGRQQIRSRSNYKAPVAP